MWAHPTVLELLELQYEFREPFIVESTKIATKLGWCDGSFAEYASAPEDQLARKPATLSFEQAAAVPISGFAALQGLRDVGEVQAGQRILVIGRPAGWGRSRSSWPRRSVTGVASTTQVDLVRSIGADDVIDNTREDVTDGVRRWDLILDTAGRRSLSQLRRALTPQGDADHRRRGRGRTVDGRLRPPAPGASAVTVRGPSAADAGLHGAAGGSANLAGAA